MEIVWGFGGLVVGLPLGVVFTSGIKAEIVKLRTSLETKADALVAAILKKI